MENVGRAKRHRFEDQTSDIAELIRLPTDPPHGPRFKSLLRRFLVFLGELARRVDP